MYELLNEAVNEKVTDVINEMDLSSEVENALYELSDDYLIEYLKVTNISKAMIFLDMMLGQLDFTEYHLTTIKTELARLEDLAEHVAFETNSIAKSFIEKQKEQKAIKRIQNQFIKTVCADYPQLQTMY